MCECCDTKGIISKNSGFPHLYHRWKYSSRDKAIYLTRDYDTGISYLVFNSEYDSGYSIDDDDDECIKLEVHNCPICGRNLDADIPEGFIEQRKSAADKVIAKQKYKRCLAMALLALEKETYKVEYEEWCMKWYKRWVELADKFKEQK